MANQYNNKVILGNETLMDITDTTATEDTVASGAVFYKANGQRSTGSALYAGSTEAGGNAITTNGILYAQVDSTSTATAFTATVPGVDSYYDGLAILLKNGVVTSAAGFTIDINGLGAKHAYNNLTSATAETTIFNINYTMLFIYDEDRVSGGGWICYRGYDANTNTIGYQIRLNSGTLPASDKGYRYRLWFTSADGTKFVPANVSTATDATTARSFNTRPIDPFGPIFYYGYNGNTNAGATLTATNLWGQYAINLGYSYEDGGSLTAYAPVYVKCSPQDDGSVVMRSITQTLPTSADGFAYLYLGIAYSATNMELSLEHPIYRHDGTALYLWTGVDPAVEPKTMTNAEVDAAFDDGWMTPYTITDEYSVCSSITKDGSYGVDVTTKVTSAYPGDTVTFAISTTPTVSSDGTTVETTYVAEYWTGDPVPIPMFVYSFVMPEGDVTISV